MKPWPILPLHNNERKNVYVDAEFAGCLDTRRSISSYIVLLNNCCISWLSKKQFSVAKSTTKAEFVAMSYGTHHIRWLLKGLADLCSLHAPIAIHADNTGANFLVVNPQLNVCTKHIAVDYYITRKALEDNLSVLLKVESVNNLADICTKILAKPAHQRMVNILGCRSCGEVLKFRHIS